MNRSTPFPFRTFPILTDGAVDVDVEATEPPEAETGHCAAYRLAVRRHGSTEKIGEVRLRLGSLEEYPSLRTSGQLGYEIRPGDRGHGYAARASRLAAQIARAHGLRRLLITCDPSNGASVTTCERLGATLEGEFPVPPEHPMYRTGRRRILRYRWEL